MARSTNAYRLDNRDIEPYLIFETIAGSRLYGLSRPNSDWDYRGIIIPPKDYFLGLRNFDQLQWHDKDYNEDCVYYDIRKFVRLCLQGNPNVLELLWSRDGVTKQTTWGKKLVALRECFITKQMVSAHIGMAKAHLDRLEKGDKPDYKDALHVVRVLDQCLRLLVERRIIFGDLGYLQNYQDILNKRFKIESIVTVANFTIENIRKHEKDIHKEADFRFINKKVVEIIDGFLSNE